uniref:Uncharacterized protein n=1 Tax=Pseudictyota dubia TaxID=2749911 RepID=A0A7R9Z5H2_9STRA|mmetsp:Transcript_25469/g.47445  ORF Transcript_25469/g.47445 Transcript_25469/m.47445 type:complete len:124 (+) Transcript_25469:586-957(+)
MTLREHPFDETLDDVAAWRTARRSSMRRWADAMVGNDTDGEVVKVEMITRRDAIRRAMGGRSGGLRRRDDDGDGRRRRGADGNGCGWATGGGDGTTADFPTTTARRQQTSPPPRLLQVPLSRP